MNIKNKDRSTALMFATLKGKAELVRMLISIGADVNTADSYNTTALMIAAKEGHLDCLKQLIDAGAQANRQDANGRSALFYATLKGRKEHVQELLKAGADVNLPDNDGNTILMQAASLGIDNIVEYIVKHQADVNVKNYSGATALYLAVFHGHTQFDRDQQAEKHKMSFPLYAYTKIVYILLEAGAHLHKTSLNFDPSTTHLQPVKIRRPNLHILRILIAAGANIDRREIFMPDNRLQGLTRDCIRKTVNQVQPQKNFYVTIPQLGLPYHLNSYLLFGTLQKVSQTLGSVEKELLQKTAEGDVDSVLNVIQTGLDINIQDENGMTALMIASKAGYVELVEKLIKTGADVNIQNLLGDTALLCATTKGQIKCVQKLLEYGTNVNIQDHEGNTALVITVKMKDEDCFDVLIKSGADPNIQTNSTSTVLALAARSGFDCTRRLIKAYQGGS